MGVPATGMANQGGKPHNTPPMCHMHKNNGKHTGETKNAKKGKKNGATKGNKCGKSTSTGTPSTGTGSATGAS